MSLIDKLLKAGSAQGASLLSESDFFLNKDFIQTPLPILNIAFSGKVDGGLTTGLTIMAGESKTFKSALSLYCMKAYLDKYPEAIGILYDSEFGITNDYIKSFGLDPTRIIHIPVEHIEHLKFDFVKKLEEIKKGDKVFFLVDSIGQISSKKEVEDAADEKSVADMTRAKAIRSLLRLITIQLTLKDIPCIMINHVYQSIGGMFPTTVLPGGTAVTYSANQIFVITKAQEKDGTDLSGWKFTLGVFKSRFVKEKSRLPFTVMYEDGIQKYSGMLDLAKEANLISQSGAWYNVVDPETGELSEKKYRGSQLETDEILGEIIKMDKFKSYVESKYTLSGINLNKSLEEEFSIDDEAEDN
jgi:RecA/RadA recombinase